MPTYGTMETLDTLRSKNETVREFGEERLSDQFMAYLEGHNEQVNSMFMDLLERTTDANRLYGPLDTMTMSRTDQHGVQDAQKVNFAGVECGFPLESFQGAWQVTRKFMQTASVKQVATMFAAMLAADVVNVINEVKRAIFTPTNYTFRDKLMDVRAQFPLNVRAFANADSTTIPPGPTGATFDASTHMHYLATASLIEANVVSLTETVLEHYARGDAYLYINRAQESTVRAFTQFVAYTPINVTGKTTADQILGRELATMPLFNRAIGQFNNVEVWVKPWIPASYMFCFLKGPTKPLVFRRRADNTGNLELVSESDAYPLRASIYEREFGIGVQERTNGAALYTASGTYAAPSIAI